MKVVRKSTSELTNSKPSNADPIDFLKQYFSKFILIFHFSLSLVAQHSLLPAFKKVVVMAEVTSTLFTSGVRNHYHVEVALSHRVIRPLIRPRGLDAVVEYQRLTKMVFYSRMSSLTGKCHVSVFKLLHLFIHPPYNPGK